MKDVNMFLQGPGAERRAVTVLATERVPLETLLCHAPNAGTGVLVDLHVLVDAQGNLARQIDMRACATGSAVRMRPGCWWSADGCGVKSPARASTPG